MPNQHRFGPLQMRVRRHGGICRLLRAIHHHAAQFRQFVPQLINRRPHVEPQIRRNLLVAAAAAVQLVSGFPDQRDQLLLDEMMNVLRFIVVEKRRRRRRLLADLLQPLQNADQFVRRQNSGCFQARARARCWPSSSYFSNRRSKPNDRCQRSKSGSSGCRNRPGPHLHRATSTRARARERDGSPRMRMNPAASFWS